MCLKGRYVGSDTADCPCLTDLSARRVCQRFACTQAAVAGSGVSNQVAKKDRKVMLADGIEGSQQRGSNSCSMLRSNFS